VVGSAQPTAKRATRPYLLGALRAVERHLHSLYAQQNRSPEQRIAAILATSDPDSPFWDDFLKASYLENLRELLLVTIDALGRPHGRV